MREPHNDAEAKSPGADGAAHAHQHPHHAMTAQRQMWWRRFNQLTQGACANEHGRPDVHKVKEWQAAHGVDPDGKIGRKSLAAARGAQAEKPSEPKAEGEDAPDEKELPEEPQEKKGEEKPASSSDPVERAAERLLEPGMSDEEKAELCEALSPRALDRLVDVLGEKATPEAKKTADVAKRIKQEKDEAKEQKTHGEGGGKTIAKDETETSFLGEKKHPDDAPKPHEDQAKPHEDQAKPHGPHKDKEPDQKEKEEPSGPKAEFTYDAKTGDLGGGKTKTGADAHKAQEKHEAREKEAEKKRSLAQKMIDKQTVVLKKYDLGTYTGTLGPVPSVQIEKEFGKKDGFGGDAKLIANQAELKANAEASWNPKDGLLVEGNASAKVTFVEGGAHVHTPPIDFTMGGEHFRGSLKFFVDAAIIAEAKGKISLNVNHKGEGGLEAEIGGFAGAKASIGVTGEMEWIKRDAADYVQRIVAAGGAEKLFDAVLPAGVAQMIPKAQYDKLLHRALPILLGDAGDALILAMTAKGEGSLGVGASAKASAHFKGGRLHCSGKAGLTVGAGLGGDVDMELGMRDGMALLAVYALMGKNHFEDELKPPKNGDEMIREQACELMLAIVQSCRDAEKDPTTSWFARQLLQTLDGMIGSMS